MKRDQDISLPYGDSRRVEWDIDDITGPDAGEPTNLLGRSVAFRVYKNSRQRDGDPILGLDDSDLRLRIDDAGGGIVSLYIGEEQSTINHRSGRYYLTVYDAETVDESVEKWTVATGAYTLTR